MSAQDRTEMRPFEHDKIGEVPLVGPHNNEAVRMCVEAWNELEGDRHSGFGTAQIPYQALVTWARVNRLDREDFTLLRRVLNDMEIDRRAREESQRKTKDKKK